MDYYPGGMLMPGRSYSSDKYRFGFNGKENDNEIKGTGNSLDFEARNYDPRIVRFWSVDPLVKKYPSQSSYSAFNNNPILFTDPSGKGGEISNIQKGAGGYTADVTVNIILYTDNPNVDLGQWKNQYQTALSERFPANGLTGYIEKRDNPKRGSVVQAKLNVKFNITVVTDYNKVKEDINKNNSAANNYVYISGDNSNAGDHTEGNTAYIGGSADNFVLNHAILHLLGFKGEPVPGSPGDLTHSNNPSSIMYGRETEENRNANVTSEETGKLNNGTPLNEAQSPGSEKAEFGDIKKTVYSKDSPPE